MSIRLLANLLTGIQSVPVSRPEIPHLIRLVRETPDVLARRSGSVFVESNQVQSFYSAAYMHRVRARIVTTSSSSSRQVW